MVLAVLQVDYTHDAAAAHQWHRQERFVTVFGQLVEKLKARIVRGLLGNGNRLAMFRYPSCNALSDAKFQPVDNFRMRILRGTKDKFVALKDVDQAGVALDQRRSEFNHAVQNFVKSVRAAKSDADFVKYVNM